MTAPLTCLLLLLPQLVVPQCLWFLPLSSSCTMNIFGSDFWSLYPQAFPILQEASYVPISVTWEPQPHPCKKQPVWWRHSERLLGETITWPYDLTSPDAPGATNPKHACRVCLMAAIKSSRAESESADNTEPAGFHGGSKAPSAEHPSKSSL